MSNNKLLNMDDFPSLSTNSNGVIKFRLGPSSFSTNINASKPVHVSNAKTRLCQNRYSCKYGDNCRFAHSLSEISLCNCNYGETCIFVKYDKEGKCENDTTKHKICFFKHPGETDDSYHKRVGNLEKVSSMMDVCTPVPVLARNGADMSSLGSPLSCNLKDMLETNSIATQIDRLSMEELDGLTSIVLEEVKRRKAMEPEVDDDIEVLNKEINDMEIDNS